MLSADYMVLSADLMLLSDDNIVLSTYILVFSAENTISDNMLSVIFILKLHTLVRKGTKFLCEYLVAEYYVKYADIVQHKITFIIFTSC
jgi:hypothetical protein